MLLLIKGYTLELVLDMAQLVPIQREEQVTPMALPHKAAVHGW